MTHLNDTHDFSPLSSPSFPSSPSLPSSPLSLHSLPSSSSALSLSPHTSAHLFLPPPLYPYPTPAGTAAETDAQDSLDTSRTLVLPELSFPWPAEHQASLYGETLGMLRVLVVARHGAQRAVSRVRRALLEENPDVLRVYSPSEDDSEHRVFAETLPGAKNVCVSSVSYDPYGSEADEIRSVLSTAHAPFRSLAPLLNKPHSRDSAMLSLLSSSGSSLFSACVLVLPPDPTPLEDTLSRVLDSSMPVLPVSLYPHPSSTLPSLAQHPQSLPDLTHTLFRSPAQIGQLRRGAAEGFLGWWEECEEVGVVDVKEEEEEEKPAERQAPLPMPILDPLHSSSLLLPALSLLPSLLHVGLSHLRSYVQVQKKPDSWGREKKGTEKGGKDIEEEQVWAGGWTQWVAAAAIGMGMTVVCCCAGLWVAA